MSKTALLVLDCQNDLLKEDGKAVGFGIAAHAKEVGTVANIANALEKARDAGVDVIYVTVSFNDDDLKKSKTPMHKSMIGGTVLEPASKGAEIVDEIKPKGEKVFNKTMISPFTIPEFVKEIAKYDKLLLAGVATNFVVESTAREAADRCKEVVILKDCCASMNNELHEMCLQVLSNLATVITSEELEL
ncbi:MAG: isochorismatase family cysteine hydrolase [Candidatus Woesearchaeota archaeon]